MNRPSIQGRCVALAEQHIDTDQILPGRFLTTTSQKGLGRYLFYDRRHFRNQTPNPRFVLNSTAAENASILIAGANFGCGSSREHAPWALVDYGIKVIISSSFADIFANNSVLNGLLLARVSEESLENLVRCSGTELILDLNAKTIEGPGVLCSFETDEFGRQCLLEGRDPFDYLVNQIPKIRLYEKEMNRERRT